MNPLHFYWLVFSYRGRHRSSARNSGFVMPLVILIGLTLTIVGFAMMQRASSQKNDATSKEATAKALSAAEAGVARIQNLINSPGSRILGTLPDCQNWNSGTNTCSDGSTDASWSNLSNLPSWTIDIPNGTAACQALTAVVTEVNAIAQNRSWQSLPQGDFRLVNYAYNGTPGVAPGTGTLTVEGRVQDAISRIEVEIPITASPDLVPVSAFWVEEGVTQNGTTTLADNNTIDSNVLISDCNVSVNDADNDGSNADELNLTAGKEGIHVSQPMPDLPDNPATNNPSDANDPTTGTPNDINDPRNYDLSQTVPQWIADRSICPTTLGNVNTDKILPQRDSSGNFTDKQTQLKLGDGTTVPAYEYCVNNIDLGGNDVVTIETIAQQAQTVTGGTNLSVGDRFLVVIYLQGTIDVGGTADMYHRCTSNCSNYKPTDLNIFGFNSLGVADPYIKLSGSSSLDAFILAPEYVYGVNGGGSGTGVTGSLLVKGVDGGSNTSNIIFHEITGVTWDDVFSGVTPGLPTPLINAISGWSTKPVN